MDIGSAFTYMFDDEEWIKKLAIGGAIALVAFILSPIIIGIVLMLPLTGYMIEVLKNVRDGQTQPLPEWSDWGGLFKTGLMVIAVVYNIPAIILACGAGIIQGVGPQLDSDTASTLTFVAVCLNCLQILVSIICNLFVPAAVLRYAQYDTLGAAFQFGDIFNFIKANIGDYIIVVLLEQLMSYMPHFILFNFSSHSHREVLNKSEISRSLEVSYLIMCKN